ncbi:MAG: DoxX family membrane protein, partial [Chloroflexi bacterium]|nr:DoxX family membrane protein [Chloroflexota bacterium]
TRGWLASPQILSNLLFGNPAAQPPTRGAIVNSEAFYRPFLEGVVQPNVGLVAQLVTIGELTVGVLLLLGLLTSLGAVIGIWLNLNYMLMKGLASNGGSVDRLFVVAELAFLVGAAGLVWGMDGLLRRPFGAIPVVRWLAGIRGERAPSGRGVAAAERG